MTRKKRLFFGAGVFYALISGKGLIGRPKAND
jgi:hypothetical protein